MEQEQQNSESVEALQRESGEPGDAPKVIREGDVMGSEGPFTLIACKASAGSNAVAVEPPWITMLRQTDELYTTYKLEAKDPICGRWINGVREALRLWDRDQTACAASGEGRATDSDPLAAPAEMVAQTALDVLMPLLAQEPVLVCQLLDTLRSGRWLVTMHRKIKDSPPDDLMSESTMSGFPVEEVPGVLQGQCRAILADEARKLQRLDARAADPQRWK